MLDVDLAVSQALRNGITGAPIAQLRTDRDPHSVVDYLSSEWSHVNQVGAKIKVYESPKRLAFELILAKPIDNQ